MTHTEPCPYCGFKSTALVIESQEVKHYRPVSYAYAYCGECGARGRIVHELEDAAYRETATLAWNVISEMAKQNV